MGVGAGLYMCDVVKKVHVRYLISWWVLVFLSWNVRPAVSNQVLLHTSCLYSAYDVISWSRAEWVRDVGSDWNKMLDLVNETPNAEYFMVGCVVCDTKRIHKLDGMACWGLSLEVPPTHRPTVCATGHTHPPTVNYSPTGRELALITLSCVHLVTQRCTARPIGLPSSSSMEGVNSIMSSITPRAENSCVLWKLCSNNEMNQNKIKSVLCSWIKTMPEYD